MSSSSLRTAPGAIASARSTAIPVVSDRQQHDELGLIASEHGCPLGDQKCLKRSRPGFLRVLDPLNPSNTLPPVTPLPGRRIDLEVPRDRVRQDTALADARATAACGPSARSADATPTPYEGTAPKFWLVRRPGRQPNPREPCALADEECRSFARSQKESAGIRS